VITGVVLARNEERNIVECLQSLRPHVEEILLIDMESTDRTVELATPLVSRVLPHPLVANLDAARNVAIPESRFDWLWFLDADERIPARTGRRSDNWFASAERRSPPSRFRSGATSAGSGSNTAAGGRATLCRGC
jgi:glycosyltransferase involved in cell wall biosynthesis